MLENSIRLIADMLSCDVTTCQPKLVYIQEFASSLELCCDLAQAYTGVVLEGFPVHCTCIKNLKVKASNFHDAKMRKLD